VLFGALKFTKRRTTTKSTLWKKPEVEGRSSSALVAATLVPQSAATRVIALSTIIMHAQRFAALFLLQISVCTVPHTNLQYQQTR